MENMKRQLRSLYFLMFVSTGLTVIMEPNDHDPRGKLGEDGPTFDQSIGHCFAQKIYGTSECINRGVLSVLQSLNEKEELNFGEIQLERSAGQSRDLLDFDYDPKDLNNVLRAATKLMEGRSMKWDLANFYPGLQMRVGPTISGNGVLEFVVDERVSSYGDRQLGTGRTLMKQLVLPFLLGFKFNLAALIPLLFGVLLIISKKALLLTKIAIVLSGFLGWNSLFSGFSGQGGINGYNPYGYGPQGGGISYPGSQYPLNFYKAADYSNYPEHVIREVVNVYEADSGANQDEERSSKNFVWTRNT